MAIVNCVSCGVPLRVVGKRDNFCPNCGYLMENQEWNHLLRKKEREKRESKKKENGNDN